MGNMFAYLTHFNQDLSKWDVSRVTNMWYMFYLASAFNQDLSKWDVSSVSDMKYMFNGAFAFNQDLSKWDVSAVSDMQFMFINSPGSISSVPCTTPGPGLHKVFSPPSKTELRDAVMECEDQTSRKRALQ